MKPLKIGITGVRGIVGETFTPEVAVGFAQAFGTYLDCGRILVCRDTRSSGPMVRSAVVAGLLAAGCEVIDLGICPTPSLQSAVAWLGAEGGIAVTASHNPAPWNGLKMFGADGAVLSADQGALVRGLYESGDVRRAAWDGTGELRVPPDVQEEHARAVLDQVSVAQLAGCRLRVFLDANAGAGGPLGARLLRDLGCEVVEHECEPTGRLPA